MDTYTMIKIVSLGIVLLLELLFLMLQSRTRRFSRGGEIARAVLAVLAFAAVVWATGYGLNVIGAVIAGLLGVALGYLTGSNSKYFASTKGTAIKASMWPAIVTALGYTAVVAALFFATGVLVSASLLLALLGAAMTVGAAIAETMRGGAVAATA